MAFKYGDFTSTNAFYWQDVDLTIYAGNDSGLTPYSILLTDAAGKTARGFIGAVGAGGAGPLGEGLAAELFANSSFVADEPPGTSWQRQGNWAVSGGVAVGNDTLSRIIYQSIGSNLNQLYLILFDLKSRTAGTAYLRLDAILLGGWTVPADGLNVYRTGQGTSTSCGAQGNQADGGFAGTIDNLSCKQVLDPPATGVHIVSAYGGSVRAWTTIDSGFNPNTITTAVVSLSWPTTGVVSQANFIHDGSNSSRISLTSAGNILLSPLGTGLVTVGGTYFRLSGTKTPASAAATGTMGDICWDSGYIYVAVGVNSWKRVALSSW